MASFTAGTTFVDGVSNDVTAAKLGNLVTNATPTSGFIQDRTAETITATNDTLLIGDASDSNNLKRITVSNFAQTLPTAKVTTGTIDTGTFGTTTSTAATITALTAGTTTSTAATITTGTIPTLVATTLVTTGTGTAATPAIVPTGDTNTGIFFPAADTIAFSEGGAEAMRIDSSGNVGIGVSPAAKLHTSTSGSSSIDETIRLDNSSNTPSNGNKITWRNAGQALECGFISGFREGATTGFGVAIGTSPKFNTGGTDAVERIRIDSVGNVGIGTTSPAAKLDVSGGNIVNTTTATGTTGLSLSNGTAGAGLSCDFSASNTYLDIKSKLFIRDSASAFAARMNIDASGNVGIGTESPAAKIHVQGAGTTSGSYTNGDAVGQALYLQDTGNLEGNGGQILFGASQGIFAGIKSSIVSGTGPAGNLIFQTRDTSGNVLDRMVVNREGKVGIGTASPANKLEVVGSFGRGAPVTKTADFTLADTENWLIVNKGSSCTVTLPAASSWTGREFTIKVITAHTVVSASSNIIPRIGGSAATAILPATDGAWATLVSNGTNWEIMCGS